jgi:ribonuclease BN (tRNA processing enzyme)
MKIRIIASASSGLPVQYASSYVIDRSLAIDAGPIGFAPQEQQADIRHLFLTHSHADHTGTLALFVENAYDASGPPVVIYGLPQTLRSLRNDIFNDRIWPDFVRISPPGRPFMRFQEIAPEQQIRVNSFSILPAMVDHVVPTLGYVITDGQSSVVFGADSGPTDRIWQLAANAPGRHSVFIEAAFPDSMQNVARISKHLTPALLSTEVAKMPEMHRIIAVHLKPRFHETISRELKALGIPNLEIGVPGQEYEL